MTASKKSVLVLGLVVVAALVVAIFSRRTGSEAPAGASSVVMPTPSATAATLTVYSGRNEKLVGSLFTAFEQKTGIKVEVRYGETPQLAALLLEEGARSPADVYVAQDAGALGALAKAGRFVKLPQAVLDRVRDERFKSPAGDWVGISGRARVAAYDTRKLKPEQLPGSVLELTRPRWKGRVGWAPSNASFQAFVTALRALRGDAAAAEWLKGMQANEPRKYKNNTAIVEALSRGEIELGLVNHYYLHAMSKGRSEPLPVANHYFDKDDPGALINVAGVGVLQSSKHRESAFALVEFLLGPEAQAHFANETFEYPLVEGVATDAKLKPIAEVGSPKLDLSRLDELRGTLQLLQEQGVL